MHPTWVFLITGFCSVRPRDATPPPLSFPVKPLDRNGSASCHEPAAELGPPCVPAPLTGPHPHDELRSASCSHGTCVGPVGRTGWERFLQPTVSAMPGMSLDEPPWEGLRAQGAQALGSSL